MGLLDAALESTLPDLDERAPGVVGSHVVVVFIGRVLERARLALDDVDQLFELLEADLGAAPRDGEGALAAEGLRRGEEEGVEERARHVVFGGAAGRSAGLGAWFTAVREVSGPAPRSPRVWSTLREAAYGSFNAVRSLG